VMPPNRNRRLPGGKVRRPSGTGGSRRSRAPQPAQREPENAASGLSEPEARLNDAPDLEEERFEAAPVVSLEEYRVARPAAAEAEAASTRRRERRGGNVQARVRTGPSSMDLVAQNYGHIRGDLLRIAVIATVMFGVIVALSFVVK
jgi:hypothetical protein